MDQDQVTVALLFVFVANRVAEALLAPAKKKYLDHDFWWFQYVSWVLAGGLLWLANVNLFPVFGNALVGRAVTAVALGGGASILSDILDFLKAIKSRMAGMLP